MYIDIQPSSLIGRGYDTVDGYEQRAPYKLVFNVFLLGDDEAFVHAMNGAQVTLSLIGEIALQLHEQYGIKTVIAERNGRKMKYDISRVLKRIKDLDVSSS